MCRYWKVDDVQLVVLGVYVDDLLTMGTDAAAIDRFFTKLDRISIKDFGVVSKFLGMHYVIEEDSSYALDQSEAIGKLFREHDLESASSTRDPIEADCDEVHSEDCAL